MRGEVFMRPINLSTILRQDGDITMKRLIRMGFLVFSVLFSTQLRAQKYALNFNGSSQYVNCGGGNLAITGANPRTVEAWVYCRTFNNAGVFQMGTPGYNLGEFTLRNAGENQWVVQIWTTDFNVTVPGSKNSWVHFAMTYDGTTIKLYCNGELATSTTRTLNTISNNFFIGRWGDNWFDGMVDEVVIYNYARTQAQIQKDLAGNISNDGDQNRIGYYKMTNGSGTLLDNDAYYHSYENDGTLNGGVTWATVLPTGGGISGNPYQISSLYDLMWLSQNSSHWDKYYLQTQDINALATANWGSSSTAGFASIGNYNTNFTGSYDGDGHTISNLYIVRTYTYDVYCQYVGLFTRTYTATITDLGLLNAYVEGYRYVGGLVGQAHTSTISNCYVTGTVKGSGYNANDCGGLAGIAESSTITSSYSTAAITAHGSRNGGLIGKNSNTSLTGCYATGNVSVSYYDQDAGGLIGQNTGSSSVSNCYATGNVTASASTSGGLVGRNTATIQRSYSSGNVNASSGIGVGGLVGDNGSGGTITNCYALGSAAGSQQAGGLVGYNSGSISYSYSMGTVNEAYNNGGLIGSGSGSVTASYWDKEASGKTSSSGGTGKTTAEMKIRTTYTDASWDFKDAGTNDIWNIANGRNSGYPYHDWQYASDGVIALATVTTTAISNISTTTASSGGNVTATGGDPVTARGVCWSTSQNPTITNSHTTDGSGTGSYASSLTGLSTSTTYYVRSYALNQAGYTYGNQQSFTTWDALPEFSASPSSHAFGTLLIGRTSQQTITVTNTGGGHLYITAVTDPGDAYTVTPTSADITGGGNLTFTLTFTPVTAGAHNGNLAFTDNAGNHTVAITGSGIFQAQSNAGNMLTLNGSSHYLDADVVTTATDNVTLEAWVNWDGQSSGSQGIIYHGNSSNSGYGIFLYSGATPARALTILCGGKDWVTSSTALPTGGWHHVAAVRENGTWKLYLDGSERSLNNTGVVPNTPAGKCNLGSSTSGGDKFKGKIDEVRIWTVARSQSQIRSSYASLAGNETGLVAYWRLDEGSGTTTGDGSGHGKTATLYGSPTWGTSTAPVTTPAFSASPSSHAFGSILIGESAQQNITISNTGGGVLNISAVSTPGAAYSVSPTSANILAGGNQVFTLTFTPTASGAQNGNLSFTDNIGNHNVAITGSGLFAAQANAGSGISFDGTDDYNQTNLDVQPSAMATTTWEAWIKPARLNYADFQGLLTTDNGGWDRGIWIPNNSNQLIIGCGVSGWIPSVTLSSGVWYHIAIVYQTDNVLFYLNGAEYSYGQAPSDQATTYNLRIGCDYNNRGFQGEIDEVRIWNTARTKTQIQSSFASLAGNESGLVAYWRFDEGSGTTTGDGSGHSHTGTLTNSPTWVGTSGAPVATPAFSASPSSHAFGSILIGESAQQNITISNTGGGVLNISAVSTPGAEKALTFNAASSQYVVIPDAINPTAYTVEMWVKPSSGTNQSIFHRTSNAQPQVMRSQQLYINGNGKFCHYTWDGAQKIVTGTTTAGADTWYHVAIVAINDGYMRLYINGLEEGTAVTIGTMQGTMDQYRIAASCASNTIGYFTGIVDEVRLFNHTRTQTMIQADYASFAGNESNLTGYWRMDEGSGTSTGDGSGHGKTATLYNSPTWGNSTAPVAAPAYQTSDGSLAFGGVLVNASSDESFTITNTAGGFLNIASIASDNARFTVSPTTANIGAGGNQEFTATFTPTTHGAQTGTLTLTHNPNSTTHTVSVSGTGQQALFSASTAMLEFGNTQVNVGKSLPVTITNNGNIALSITGIVCDPTKYTISPATASISAGGNQVFTVTLTPTATGSVPGTITFTDNALNSPQQIAATGTGVELYGSGTVEDPYQIATLYDLRFLSEHSSYWGSGKHFIQTADIDASATSGYNSGAGFSPIGIPGTGYFQGTYDGDGHIIDGLVINRSGTNYQGLFGATMGGVIKNLGLTNVNVSGKEHTGALVGQNSTSSTIQKCYSTGTVTGYYNSTGGLAGTNQSSSLITQCFSSVTCAVSGSGLWSLGSLVGYNNSATITNSYATGSVTGINAVGGLVGNNTSGAVTKCFSTGAVSGSGSNIGGLIGGFGAPTSSFWDKETSGQTGTQGGGTGKTTAEMKVRATFIAAGWDFRGETANGEDDIWNIGNSRNSGYPYLDWQYPADPVIALATVATVEISSITTSSASSGGAVTNNANGTAVTARGICWGYFSKSHNCLGYDPERQRRRDIYLRN